MLCPNCKKENPEGTQFCANCGANFNAPVQPVAKQKKPITKKWWFWVIIVVVVVGLISAISGGGDDETTTTGGESVSQNADAGTTKAPETTTRDNMYSVGEILNDGDVVIEYISAEKWTDYDQYSSPEAGNMVVRIKVAVTNNSTNDYYISPYDFACYADNQNALAYYSGEEVLETVNLSAGRNTSGYVYFEVPENAENIEIEFETNYWTDEKAVFVVEL